MGDPRFLGTEQRRRMGAESSHVGMTLSKEDLHAHRIKRHSEAVAYHNDRAAEYRLAGRPDLADWHDQEADFHRGELAKYYDNPQPATSSGHTIREIQNAALKIGDAEVNRITGGVGLSGASGEAHHAIVEAARRLSEQRRTDSRNARPAGRVDPRTFLD